MIVTFEEIKNLRYYSTPKRETHQRHEILVARARRTMGSDALAYRIPYVLYTMHCYCDMDTYRHRLERLVECGKGSKSYDPVHEDRHPFATFHLRCQALDEVGPLGKSESVMSRAELQTLIHQLKVSRKKHIRH